MSTTETPQRATDTYRAAETALRTGREAWRQEELELMASRDSALRSIVGTQRGGVTCAARTLEISDAQVFRMLDEGITRAVHIALDRIDVERSDYQLTHQRGGRSIGIVLLTDAGPSEAMVTHALEERGLRLVGRRSVSPTTTDALRWMALKSVKRAAQSILAAANISSRTYRLVERRGESMVRLTLTPIMGGVVTSALDRFTHVLQSSGLVVEVEDREAGMLLIGTRGIDEPMVQELLFTWAD